MNQNSLLTFLQILSTASSLLANPLLSSTGVAQVATLINYVSGLVSKGIEATEELSQVNDLIKTLNVQGRGPNAAEWATWDQRLAAVSAGMKEVEAGLGAAKPA